MTGYGVVRTALPTTWSASVTVVATRTPAISCSRPPYPAVSSPRRLVLPSPAIS